MVWIFVGPYLLAEVSRSFHEDHDRWPRDYEELMTYCEEVDLLTFKDVAGEQESCEVDVDLYMFRDIRFTPCPDGKLKIDYTIGQPPRADGARGVSVTAAVTVHLPDDDVPCDEIKTAH